MRTREQVVAPAPEPGSDSLAKVFSGRRNAIAFLRWLFAVLVIWAHAYPLGGYYSNVPLAHWTHGQVGDLGDLAVIGFFVLSGFLVTRSRDRARSAGRYMWHRFLRIFPGFWVCLAVTAFVLAPIEWRLETGHWSGLFALGDAGPVGYFTNNFLLTMHHWTIGPLLSHAAYGRPDTGGIHAWDGSLWTLIYEFRCYLIVLVVGAVASLTAKRRVLVGLFAATAVALLLWNENALTWLLRAVPEATPLAFVRFLFAFLCGALAYLYADRIRITIEGMVMAAAVFVFTLHLGLLYLVGYPAYAYLVLGLAVRLPIRRWDRFGDLSYGLYIYAFIVQMLLSEHHFSHYGFLAYLGLSLLLSHVAAFLSWHLVERHALKLKDVSLSSFGRRRHRRRLVQTEAVAVTRAQEPVPG